MNIKPAKYWNIKKTPQKVEWRSLGINDDRKVFSCCDFDNKIFGNISVNIKDYWDGFGRWVIELKNSLDKLMGYEIVLMEKDSHNFMGNMIEVLDDYRRKGYGFGEILRLFSVMLMNENKSKRFEIYSRGSAVYFHSKYKFVPYITRYSERDDTLNMIAKDKSAAFRDLAVRAKELIEMEKKNNIDFIRRMFNETNKLVQEYIELAAQEPKPEKTHPFNFGLPMVLTDKNLYKNKKFYNELYTKYGLDYSI